MAHVEIRDIFSFIYSLIAIVAQTLSNVSTTSSTNVRQAVTLLMSKPNANPQKAIMDELHKNCANKDLNEDLKKKTDAEEIEKGGKEVKKKELKHEISEAPQLKSPHPAGTSDDFMGVFTSERKSLVVKTNDFSKAIKQFATDISLTGDFVAKLDDIRKETDDNSEIDPEDFKDYIDVLTVFIRRAIRKATTTRMPKSARTTVETLLDKFSNFCNNLKLHDFHLKGNPHLFIDCDAIEDVLEAIINRFD